MHLNHFAVNVSTDSATRYHQFSADFESALKQWNDHKLAISLKRWHIFRNTMTASGCSARRAADILLLSKVDDLQAIDARLAHIQRSRFFNGEKMEQVANKLNLDDSRVYKLQADGIKIMVDELWEDEKFAIQKHRQRWEARLDAPTYTELIGTEGVIQELYQLLQSSSPPWIVALEGIGGIGKTSTASALIRHLIDYSSYADFAWVSAKRSFFNQGGALTQSTQPVLSAEGFVDVLLGQLEPHGQSLLSLSNNQKQDLLRTRLKERAHFIVIDNLETLQDVEALLPILHRWSNPTRFLLTSRVRFETDASIYHYVLHALDRSNALRLIRHEAQLRNNAQIVNASNEELAPIYDVVGGNPLALRLVVGLSHAHGVDPVLDDLQNARGTRVEALYMYIFKWAWEILNEAARHTWLAMPLIETHSASIEELTATMADLEFQPDQYQVRFALDQLVQLNLVDSLGELHSRRYSIHQLTRTFLQEQVAQWI